MYNSQYYTCEQIDQRLLQGYLDDYNNENNTSLTKAQFLQMLFTTIGKSATVDNLVAQLGYYICDTASGTAAKILAVSGYELFNGGSIKVKFINKNTANNGTLNINSKGAKALYYQGERVSSSNTWEANEIVEIYYDGEAYYANNVKGGSGDGIYDVSLSNLTDGNPTTYDTLSAAIAAVPTNKRKGGMSIKFIRTSDNKYVQYRLKTRTFSINPSNWVNVEEEAIQYETVMSANIHNSATATPSDSPQPTNGSDWLGHTLDSSAGKVVYVAASSYSASSPIKVDGGASYKCSVDLRKVYWSDAEGAMVGRVTDITTAGSELVAPNNAEYIHITYVTGSLTPADVKFGKYTDDIDVDYNGEVVDKDKYGKRIITNDVLDDVLDESLENFNNTVITPQISDLQNSINEVEDGVIQYSIVVGANIHNSLPAAAADAAQPTDGRDWLGHLLDTQFVDGQMRLKYVAGSSYTTVAPIQIVGGVSYKSNKNIRKLYWLNSDGIVVERLTNEISANTAIPAPNTATQVQFFYSTSLVTAPGDLKFGKYTDDIDVPYTTKIVDKDKYERVLVLENELEDKVEEIIAPEILDLNSKINNVGGGLRVVKDDSSVSFVDADGNQLNAEFKNVNTQLSMSPIFNWVNIVYDGVSYNEGDELGTFNMFASSSLGNNHGWTVSKVTIANHGLTNTAIGTAWVHSNTKTYYVIGIVDSDNILMVSGNTGTSDNQTYLEVPTGTISKDGVTLTITARSAYAIPVIKNLEQKIMLNGTVAIGDEYDGYCNYADVLVSYDFMSMESILSNLIARAGSSAEPVYDGDTFFHCDNVHRILSNLSAITMQTIYAKSRTRVKHAGISAQKRKYATNDNAKYYVPNSLAVAATLNTNFNSPVPMTPSSEHNSWIFDRTSWADANDAVNRVLQILEGKGVVFTLGFLPIEIGGELSDVVNRTFEIRNDSCKVYPSMFNSLINEYMEAGDILSACLYRSVSKVPNGSKIAQYAIPLNDKTYVYVDYSASATMDKVIVDENLNGKKVEVVQAVNTTLVNTMYCDGFYVNASYVQDESCFIVVRIY